MQSHKLRTSRRGETESLLHGPATRDRLNELPGPRRQEPAMGQTQRGDNLAGIS